jgi:2-dehydropantoate 2-reductase
MNIAIVGAGSLGLLFASYLSSAFSVTLYTRTDGQAEEIRQNGLFLKTGSQITRTQLSVYPVSEWQGTEELTIVAVKEYQLESIIQKINDLKNPVPAILFIQNGMSHLELLRTLPVNTILIGSVEHGAVKENENTVLHHGKGDMNIAVYKGDGTLIRKFVSLAPTNFPITIKDNYYDMLVNKLIANAVINPLTAILRVNNGELVNNSFYYKALTAFFSEISVILNLTNPDEHLKNIINICKKTADNRSSMLKDIEKNRRTEVDAILGFILAEAKRNGKKAVVTEGYYYLVKGKEKDRGDSD